MPLSTIDADLRAWEQSIEQEGGLPIGSLRQGRVTLQSSPRSWAVWTRQGGVISCLDLEAAATLAPAISRSTGSEADLSDIRSTLVSRLPNARCETYLTSFRPPSPAPVDPILARRVEKVGPEEVPTRNRPATAAEQVFAIRYGPTIVSYAHSYPRLRVGDHWLCDVGVSTHQGSRRRGYARAVLSTLLQHLTEERATTLWRCVAANQPSVNLAHSLGFADHIWTMTWETDGAV